VVQDLFDAELVKNGMNVAQEHGVPKSSQTAVAVRKRMDELQLIVKNAASDHGA
jgi:hypothetical protein